jgi:hypothetical protein
MKTTTTILAVLALGGCASAPELMEAGPKVSVLSSKSLTEIRECFALVPTTSAQPHGEGWMIKGVLPASYYAPAWFTILKAEGDGTRVDIYYPSAYPGWRHTSERCA